MSDNPEVAAAPLMEAHKTDAPTHGKKIEPKTATSPETRLVNANGTIVTQNIWANPSVTVPDTSQFLSIMFKESLYHYVIPILGVHASAYTVFDQAWLTQIIIIICMLHTEKFCPISTRRSALISLYKDLMAQYGSLILLDHEVTLIEALLPVIMTGINSGLNVVMAVLPDTPGIDIATTTGYVYNDTSAYYFTPPWVLFDHLHQNAQANQNHFVALNNPPNNYATSPFMRSSVRMGLNKILGSSVLAFIDGNYARHQALNGLADTWEYFTQMDRTAVTVRQWMFGMTARRNATIQQNNIPHSPWELKTILKKNWSPETNRSNRSLVIVQRPIDTPAAAPGNNHPDRSDMTQQYYSSSAIAIPDDEFALGTMYALNSYYPNNQPATSFIGSVQPTPRIDPVNRERYLAARNPIPSWAGPIMSGPLFNGPLIAQRATYDRTLTGLMD